MANESQVVVKISADGTDLRKELDNDLRALHAFAGSANEANGTAVKAVRESIAAQREYATSVGATTEQMQRLTQINDQFENSVERVQIRQSQQLNNAARGFAILESSSGASIRSVDALATSIARLALGFGPEGLLVGGFLMLGAVAYREINKAREETEKLRDALFETAKHAKTFAEAMGEYQAMNRLMQADMKELDVLDKKIAGETLVTLAELDARDAVRERIIAEERGIPAAKVRAEEIKKVNDAEQAIKDAKEHQRELDRLAKEHARELKQLEHERFVQWVQHLREEDREIAARAKAEAKETEVGGLPGVAGSGVNTMMKGSMEESIQLARQFGNAIDADNKKLQDMVANFQKTHTVGALAFTAIAGAAGVMTNMLEGGHLTWKKALQGIGSMLVSTLQGLAIKDYALAQSLASWVVTAEQAPPVFAAAYKEEAGAIAIAGLMGVAGGGGGHGGGGGGGGGGSVGTANGAQGVGAPSNTTVHVIVDVVQKTPDGRQIASIRQAIQRATDSLTPIRATL